jgi:hypothetical protein
MLLGEGKKPWTEMVFFSAAVRYLEVAGSEDIVVVLK